MNRYTNADLGDIHFIYGLANRNGRVAVRLRFLLGVRTVNSPQSHIVRVCDAGLGKSGVFHSAEWHVGDWLSDGIREAWLMFFIWVLDESRSFFRVHTGYFLNIPKCIKAEFIASWGCSQSSVVSSSQR
ncbi:hypothetical protein TNCV_4708531 [Trichonephila clavipes]|nr:hypothetical protein TNCV_4708531 [Trichonephila clavipes]